MPSGVMKWFDAASGQGRVVRGSRELVAHVTDIEPAARAPGARVTFDRVREDGAERAVNVRLRRGLRVSPRQGRFGSLAGARRPDQKGQPPLTRHRRPPTVRRLEERPLEAARHWASCISRGDLDAAAGMYNSEAVLHDGEGTAAGPRGVRRFLAAAPLVGVTPSVIEEEAGGQTVRIEWPGEPTATIRLRIEHGQIAEQWLG